MFNGMDFLYNYIYNIYIIIIMFQALRRAVNVLKLIFLRVSKYPPNAMLVNATALGSRML